MVPTGPTNGSKVPHAVLSCGETKTKEANGPNVVSSHVKTILRILAVALAGGVLVLATSWAFAPGGRIEPPAPGVRAARHDVYNPVTAGEPLPEGFRQLLPRDGIQPIYDPQFTSAAAVDWPGETQVIGVAAGGEAKAYPVSFLDQHEMVNDFIAGDPILVTW